MKPQVPIRVKTDPHGSKPQMDATRDIPGMLNWLAVPFVTGIAGETWGPHGYSPAMRGADLPIHFPGTVFWSS
jgi:hypothetical protein